MGFRTYADTLKKRLSELEDRSINFKSRPHVFQTNGQIPDIRRTNVLLTDLTTIENTLEARFGDCHLTQFYRTELKTRRQEPGESLQVLAADVERLMSLAYAECPQDVRDSLAAQYFVDAIRDEDTQHATRLMRAKDLKSALAYSMKYEAAKTVSKTSR
ncbi:hypothetical protein AVEN_50848-1 [Araneus ventricosus]|uniref:Uncharacterized protein n=1 Tax=Araneus ventricosus TaxID=182803 RepID=A0A4Y2VEM4_ARAVE|nr:hypothetical protein AVEN_50848-1 [Araneus ventricosus]